MTTIMTAPSLSLGYYRRIHDYLVCLRAITDVYHDYLVCLQGITDVYMITWCAFMLLLTYSRLLGMLSGYYRRKTWYAFRLLPTYS